MVFQRLKQIERDLEQVEAGITNAVKHDASLSESADILARIPGIAMVTACAMLIEMPELGKLSGKQVASLAGVAPM